MVNDDVDLDKNGKKKILDSTILKKKSISTPYQISNAKT